MSIDYRLNSYIASGTTVRSGISEFCKADCLTIIDTCRQVFMVSNIHYFITRANQAGGKFVCYLNFDNNNIRVITEF